jgi:hypothetical protein
MGERVPYVLTAHEAVTIAERGILPDWIERGLADPQKVLEDARDQALRHALARIPEYGNRVLRVINIEATKPRRVVTAYFDRTQRDMS